MDDFLRWLAVGVLPLASLTVGFVIHQSLDHQSSEASRRLDGKTLLIALVLIITCSLRLVGQPIIEPLWLQYVLLIPGSMALGLTLRALLTRTAAEH